MQLSYFLEKFLTLQIAINPVAIPSMPTFLAPGLIFSKIKKHPTISERDERI